MSDAATKLAHELKRGHKESKTWPGQCDNCEGDWPCAPRRAADMLLELAREQRVLGERWEPGSCVMEDAGCEILDRYHAARNATQEKPRE